MAENKTWIGYGLWKAILSILSAICLIVYYAIAAVMALIGVISSLIWFPIDLMTDPFYAASSLSTGFEEGKQYLLNDEVCLQEHNNLPVTFFSLSWALFNVLLYELWTPIAHWVLPISERTFFFYWDRRHRLSEYKIDTQLAILKYEITNAKLRCMSDEAVDIALRDIVFPFLAEKFDLENNRLKEKLWMFHQNILVFSWQRHPDEFYTMLQICCKEQTLENSIIKDLLTELFNGNPQAFDLINAYREAHGLPEWVLKDLISAAENGNAEAYVTFMHAIDSAASDDILQQLKNSLNQKGIFPSPDEDIIQIWVKNCVHPCS